MPHNWAGTYAYTAPTILTPASIDEVRRAVAAGGRVRALGTRHSFTDLPDTTGTLLEMIGLPPRFDLDATERTVTVAAGTRYGVVAEALHERGWALRNMGSLPHINVAGATQAATHGSGDANGVLTTGVRALQYVGAGGEVHDVRRGDADFAALAVGLGAFGVITAVTLDVVPAYRLRQDVFHGVTWDAALDDLDAITGAGYSVSVFTRWDDASIGFVWVKTLLDHDDDIVPSTLAGGRREDALDSPLGAGDNITEIGGVPGPWLLRLPHFRLDREPSFGSEIQSEYFVARADAPAALRAVRELAASGGPDGIRPHLIWSELRTAAADDLWLSPAYERDALIIHFTWHDHRAEVAALVPQIEAALAPFDARPHWGKVHGFDRSALERVVPRLADARAVFERLDPEGVFTNAHLERVGVREPR